jgi:hypothetical protein
VPGRSTRSLDSLGNVIVKRSPWVPIKTVWALLTLGCLVAPLFIGGTHILFSAAFMCALLAAGAHFVRAKWQIAAFMIGSLVSLFLSAGIGTLAFMPHGGGGTGLEVFVVIGAIAVFSLVSAIFALVQLFKSKHADQAV